MMDPAQPLTRMQPSEKLVDLDSERAAARAREDAFSMLVPSVVDYAMFTLAADGTIASWDARAQRLLGYTAGEIVGRPYALLYAPAARTEGKPERELAAAATLGSTEDSGSRVRKDGATFIANALLTAVRRPDGALTGYVNVIHELSESVDTSEQFRLALEAASTGMIMVDENGLIALVNAQVEKSFGYLRKELIGKPIEVLLPQRLAARHIDYRSHYVDAPRARPMGIGRELHGRHRDGTEVPVEIGLNPLRAGGRRFVLASIVDITERKRADTERERLLQALRKLNAELEARVVARTAELTATLKEREVLLQEIHHRVKNNLQVISSLINMQVRKLAGSADRDALVACQTRIQAIALIHEKLYQAKDYARVRFDEYARSLAGNVFQASGPWSRSVRLELDIEPVDLAVERAIPCGLILNELITNALKHAFPDGRRGSVRIEFRRVGNGRVSLTVSDDGIGMPPQLDPRESDSLGMQLVFTLADQLDAETTLGDATGSSVRLVFSAEGDEK